MSKNKNSPDWGVFPLRICLWQLWHVTNKLPRPVLLLCTHTPMILVASPQISLDIHGSHLWLLLLCCPHRWLTNVEGFEEKLLTHLHSLSVLHEPIRIIELPSALARIRLWRLNWRQHRQNKGALLRNSLEVPVKVENGLSFFGGEFCIALQTTFFRAISLDGTRGNQLLCADVFVFQATIDGFLGDHGDPVVFVNFTLDGIFCAVSWKKSRNWGEKELLRSRLKWGKRETLKMLDLFGKLTFFHWFFHLLRWF